MSYRSLLLALLSLVGLPGIASAGVAGWGNPDDLHGSLKDLQVRLSGKISGFKVTNKHGRTVEVRLPRLQSLDAPITLPAGEWAELTLVLDGPVTVRAGAAEVVLEVDALTVPLADPDAHRIHLDWTLPADRRALSTDALVTALQDGGLAVP